MANFSIEFGGKTYDVEAPDADAAYRAFAEAFNLGNDAPKGEGDGVLTTVAKALQHGVAAQAEGYGNTARAAGASDAGKAVNRVGRALEPSNYDPAMPKVGLSPSTWGNIPQALLEASPGLATDLAAGAAGGAVGSLLGPIGTGIGSLGGFGASFASRNWGNNVQDRVRADDPKKDIEDASTSDKLIAGASTAGEAALNRIGLGKALSGVPVGAGVGKVAAQLPGQIAKSAAAEAAGGAAGNIVNQVGRTAGTSGGLSIDPNEVGASGVMGGATGAAVRGARVPKDLAQANRLAGFETDPAATNRLVTRLEESERGVSNPKDAYRAVDNVQRDLAEKRKTARSEAKEFLENETAARELVDKQIKKLEDGQLLTARELDDLDARLGKHSDTASLLENIRDQNQTNRLMKLGHFDQSNESFGGGLQNSALGRATNPLAAKNLGRGGVADAVLAMLPTLAGSAFGLPTGSVTAAGAGLNAGMRAFDAARGTKNPTQELVQRFANRDAPDTPAQDLPGYISPQRQADEAAYRQAQIDKINRQEATADAARQRDAQREIAAEEKARESAFRKAETVRRSDEAAARRQADQEDRAWASQADDPRVKTKQEDRAWAQKEKAETPPRARQDWSDNEAANAIRQTLAARDAAMKIAQKGQAPKPDTAEAEPQKPTWKKAKEQPAPTDETHFEYKGLFHPRPDKTINKRGWEAATRKNQETIMRQLDLAIGEGVEVKTGEAVLKHTSDLRTARSQEEARIVINRIVKDSDPDDRPQVRKALLDPNFLATWKKTTRGE